MIDDEGYIVFFTQEGDGVLVHKPDNRLGIKIGEMNFSWSSDEFIDFNPGQSEPSQTAMPLPRLMENPEGTVVLFYGPEEGILVYEEIEPDRPSSVGLVTYAIKDHWKEFKGAVTLSNR